MTQQAIADAIGWSVPKIKQYSALRKIDENAWNVVVTTFNDSPQLPVDDQVTEKVTMVTFSERLLRPIIQLTPEQQLQLVSDLTALPLLGSQSKNTLYPTPA